MAETHPQNRRLGYARVSTYGQTLDAQLEQLRAEGCSRIYREKVTGARADRRELLKMLKGLAPGDVVTVTRIDRLARSTFDLFAIVKQIGVGITLVVRFPGESTPPLAELHKRTADVAAHKGYSAIMNICRCPEMLTTVCKFKHRVIRRVHPRFQSTLAPMLL